MFKRIKYPDGQISAQITERQASFQVKERINNYEDLMFIRSIAEVASYQDTNISSVFIPCLFGQRSDRRFEENNSFDLKIIAEIINSCNFKRVEIFDPHSEVCMGMINNSKKITSYLPVSRAIVDIKSDKLILISPDGGAYKKVFEYGQRRQLPIAAASKHRDLNGEISIKFIGDVEGKDCLIVDDICDGGRTFIELSAELRKQGANKVYLYISHAYFSQGLMKLRESLDHIYCTNSVNDLPDSWFDGNGTVPVKDFVTQYKII